MMRLNFMKWTTCLMLVLLWIPARAIDIDQVGDAVVKDLRDRYQNTTVGCGANQKLPAFECSGIMFRATGHGDYDPWDPSPISLRTGGISFSYWRADIISGVFGDLPNGYVWNAPERAEANGKKQPYVLCYFPVNAASVNRGGESGCGELLDYIDNRPVYYFSGSSPCQLQGIYTAEDWYEKYFQPSVSLLRLCGFNVRDYRDGAVGNAQKAFHQGILASTLMWKNWADIGPLFKNNINNEIIVRTWGNGARDQLPIQAFFYTAEAGKRYAMNDQGLFYKETGQLLPVIKVSSPGPEPGKMTFTYQHDDQSVQP
ncbi:hypothetical protein PMI16_02154 [Herbaspirillum sp. CF444]|uniref:hypothetical protein n=1 Tax=Herbaspirillum sp. CF444 TaxID=1144319 RepID=UPI0002726E64|nr:hypothetical protein [Herbaspirillum sp. CF444]EJL88510.1 hypothetical protein PMI16_02154 [Herbaspirillum sp. CF444]